MENWATATAASTFSGHQKKILDDVVQFSIGDEHVGAVKKDGSLYMWGSNSSGQLNLPGGNYTHSMPFMDASSPAQTTPVTGG